MSEPAWVPLGGAVGGDVVYEAGWSSTVTYQPGDVVTYQGVHYIAVQPSTNQPPPASTASIPYGQKGAAGGVATLDATGKVPVAQVPARELAYAEFAITVAATVVTESAAVEVVTAPAVTFDGATPVLIDFYSPLVNPAAVSAAEVRLILFADGVTQGMIGFVRVPMAGNMIVPALVQRRLTPPAGSHTYGIRTHAVGATGYVIAGGGGPGAYLPGFIRISRAT